MITITSALFVFMLVVVAIFKIVFFYMLLCYWKSTRTKIRLIRKRKFTSYDKSSLLR